MKSRWSLKEHNEGASLIAVLTSVLFVMTIAAIVLNVTITNIRMRQVEEAEKRSFYSAEQVMDELSVNLNNAASQAMQEAYTGILTNYTNLTTSGKDLQAEFTKRYMNNLTELFWDQNNETRKEQKVRTKPDDVGELIYVWGYYNQTEVSSRMPSGTGSFFVSSDSEATFSADYVEGLFTLHNVKIDYEDAQGYAAAISTDMVFHTPVMNFEGSYKIMNYMNYAMIADEQIYIFGSGNVNVDGSIYAGHEGILVYDSDAAFGNGDIVTRGSIEVTSGSNAVFGDAGSRVWAENIVTSGKGEPSTLVLDGNIYVADDLSINGKDSKVELRGNYYGYNFLEKYDGSSSINNGGAQFSSAIMINGKNCRLDMSGLNYLLLAGRTYLSRGSDSAHDVVLGESLSVRTNQLAYYVPERFLNVIEESFNASTDTVNFTTSGAAEYSGYAGVDNIATYLDASTPIAVYRFLENGKNSERYYLNFKDEQSANNFFTKYWSANQNKMSSYGSSFADAIILGNEMLYTLKGDLMSRNAGADFDEQHVEITSEQWRSKAENISTGTDGIYYTFANQLAINYKSLQTYLEDYSKNVDSSHVRFYNGTTVDKSVDRLLDNLIDWSKVKASECTNYNVNGNSKNELLFVVTDNASDIPYTVKAGWQKGIIIATGDVNVACDFTGIIIAGGKINVSSSANVKVTADPLLVSKMFADDAQSGSPKFSHLFKDYGTLSESVIGVVRIDEYLTYENWRRSDF